ncbi:MAG: hypothetical protein JXQ90_21470 [Cyclobacteriaceae bacterium]
MFTKATTDTERNCEWVSSRGIAQSCDVYPDPLISDEKSINIDAYRQIKHGDTVYVVSKSLKKFTENILPNLEQKQIQITLVTGASVRGVPHEITNQHGIDYNELLAKSRSIQRWFSQNLDAIQTSDIKPIPLGLDYHTLRKKSYWWGTQTSPTEQEKELLAIKNSALPFVQRKNRTYSFFHFNMFDRHDNDRQHAIDHLNQCTFNDYAPSRMVRSRTWKICSQYRYIVSPHGNGLDCHRTYEAIALGCIPIVRSSSLDVIYEELPVLILEKWSDLSQELLDASWKELLAKPLDALNLSYWTDHIK